MVEAALYEHPGVREAAVVGVPETADADTMVAVVALSDPEALAGLSYSSTRSAW
jgi:acyl-coenzyme A synthetase/AMP-(fatty) acid ligase